jgi:hypothetical protein
MIKEYTCFCAAMSTSIKGLLPVGGEHLLIIMQVLVDERSASLVSSRLVSAHAPVVDPLAIGGGVRACSG